MSVPAGDLIGTSQTSTARGVAGRVPFPAWIEARNISDLLANGPQPDPHAHLRLPNENGCPRHWTLTFGKHRGERLCDVPTGYVRWLARQNWIDERTALMVSDYARVYRWARIAT